MLRDLPLLPHSDFMTQCLVKHRDNFTTSELTT